jgi:hypothetical protein
MTDCKNNIYEILRTAGKIEESNLEKIIYKHINID